MRARIEMELEDVPGQLVKVIDPISRFGANIQSVVHQREKKTPLGRVPVTVIFDVDDKEKLDRIVGSLKELGAHITRIGEKEAAFRDVALLVGHIVHTDIQDTVDRLNSLHGVRLSDLSLSVGKPGEDSAARVVIEVTDESGIKAALSELGKLAEEKGLLTIKSLGAHG